MNIVLFQKDLRVRDHEPLMRALKQAQPVVGLFCIEFYEEHLFGFQINPAIKQFLYDSLNDLRMNLEKLHVPLHITSKSLKEALELIGKQNSIENIYMHRPEGIYEEQMIYNLQTSAYDFKIYDGKTLIHPSVLPFELSELPLRFTDFKNKIKKPVITEIALPAAQKPFNVELLNDLDLLFTNQSTYRGGEREALQQLEYLFTSNMILNYKETRNNLLPGGSTFLSPYLAWGNISIRTVYNRLKRFEKEVENNESTYWLYFELLWRDFFYFNYLKYKERYFSKSGISAHAHANKSNPIYIEKWIQSETGYPLVDAAMKELKETGFLSNRARQNVASFFTKYISQDYRIGAAYFQANLIDFDLASNQGNWLYIAGLGNDPIQNRIFNVQLQGQRYDRDALYVKHWIKTLLGTDKRDIYTIDGDLSGYISRIVPMPKRG